MHADDVTDVSLVHDTSYLLHGLAERFSARRVADMRRTLEHAKVYRACNLEELSNLTAIADALPDVRFGEHFHQLVRSRRMAFIDASRRISVLEGMERSLAANVQQNVYDVLGRLWNMPAVTDVGLLDGCLCVRIAATYCYHGRTYDLGDWLLRFPPYWQPGEHVNQYFDSLEVRSGRQPGWQATSYPYYGLSDGGFCFGVNRPRIIEHVRQGNLLQAVTAAIGVMCSVNALDEPLVPRAFRLVTPPKALMMKGC